MKTWTMPKVKVEAFRANDYVAATCVTPDNVKLTGNYAMDLVNASGSSYYPIAVLYGEADGEYQNGYENINSGGVGISSDFAGVYRNKKLYAKSHGPSNGIKYSNTYYFTALEGVYTLWVTESAVHAWIYEGDVEIDTSSGSPWNPNTGSNRS